MYKIAITGATGFVGGFISNYLESKDNKVFRFGRKKQKGIIYWDITKSVYNSYLDVDCVIHCAAHVNDWASYGESYAVNVLGTQNVLKSFPRASKFIYLSSASVYNSFCNKVIISENDCLGGKLLNNYSRTKLMGENEVKKSKIISKIILRPHIIYGLGDTTIAPRIKKGIKFGYLIVPGNGKNRISFTNIENLAQAVWGAVKLSKKGISVYNITDRDSFVLVDALNKIKKLNNLKFKELFISKKLGLIIGYIFELAYSLLRIKKAPPLTRYIINQMSSDHVLDISRAQKDLQYCPIKNIEDNFLL